MRKGDRVVLLLPNSAAFPVAAIGCMLAGAVFVPLSPEDPWSRLQRLVSDCVPKVVVTAADDQEAPLTSDLPGAASMLFSELLDASPVRRTWHADPVSDAYIIGCSSPGVRAFVASALFSA